MSSPTPYRLPATPSACVLPQTYPGCWQDRTFRRLYKRIHENLRRLRKACSECGAAMLAITKGDLCRRCLYPPRQRFACSSCLRLLEPENKSGFCQGCKSARQRLRRQARLQPHGSEARANSGCRCTRCYAFREYGPKIPRLRRKDLDRPARARCCVCLRTSKSADGICRRCAASSRESGSPRRGVPSARLGAGDAAAPRCSLHRGVRMQPRAERIPFRFGADMEPGAAIPGRPGYRTIFRCPVPGCHRVDILCPQEGA